MSRFLLTLGVAAVLLVAAVSGRAASPPTSQNAEPPFDATTSTDPDAVLFRKVCANCHPADRIIGSRYTASEWEETIGKMIAEGAKGTDDELQAVFKFLVKRFGKVQVNIAPADEIAAVLSLSDAQAQAIVQYRAGHGKFADVEALRKVPGLEMAKLNAEAITFK